MKALVAILLVLLLALQYRLWFGDGSVQEVSRLRDEALTLRAELGRLEARNQALTAEVEDLRSGNDAIEERARADLGMVGRDETFYRFVREDDDTSGTENAAKPASGDAEAESSDRESIAEEPAVVPEME